MFDRDMEQEHIELAEDAFPDQVEMIRTLCAEWGVDWQDFLLSISLRHVAHLGCASYVQLSNLVRAHQGQAVEAGS